MPTGPGRGVAAGAPPAPEPDLLAASAMVFVPDPAAPVLTEDDVRHLLDVLRLRSGELVIAGDGAGSWAPCRVRPGSGSRGSRGVDPTSALAVDGPVVFRPRPAPAITVAFAPAKGDRPEWVTQKLT
ncbi:MAG TPA: RNA methyltransferase PUA domain-containing protein, partial [Acidimicrobiales bacterium]|nr:RNA methyltransferase PUA domain-containing protein [Acidimicrobiales bacterium]